ncbi:MAG: hypothetical protein Q8R70_11480 [Methanoregula sp.]|nr:hypothetical protein [Methanoregula sp.]
MDQRNVKCEVEALWLQYFGLKTEYTGRSTWIENAAHLPGPQRRTEQLPVLPGLIIAT